MGVGGRGRPGRGLGRGRGRPRTINLEKSWDEDVQDENQEGDEDVRGRQISKIVGTSEAEDDVLRRPAHNVGSYENTIRHNGKEKMHFEKQILFKKK